MKTIHEIAGELSVSLADYDDTLFAAKPSEATAALVVKTDAGSTAARYPEGPYWFRDERHARDAAERARRFADPFDFTSSLRGSSL